MNKADRKQFENGLALIDEGKSICSDIADSEREKFENIPENLQCSDRATAFEARADEIDSVCDEIDSLIDSLREAAEQ